MNYFCIPGIPEIERLEIQLIELERRAYKELIGKAGLYWREMSIESRKKLYAIFTYKFCYFNVYPIARRIHIFPGTVYDWIHRRGSKKLYEQLEKVKNKIFGF